MSAPHIVTRIAPSPTGSMHLGTARTALFNFLYARQHGGTFILRIEDTDRERSKKEYEENILESLEWLGLAYDVFARQSERTHIYREHLERLVAGDKAYISKEDPGDSGRSEVVRLRNPNRSITFSDEIRGDITFETAELGDFIIAKSMEEPLYHFAVVVDDYLMKVTHVVRGEDHISNTPRQILIAEALGAPIPTYAHLPLILAPDRSKLSKRHGAVSVTEYRERGYLPEAVLNFLALLGWSSQQGSDAGEEVLSIDDLIRRFDLSRVGKSGAIFNIEKLDWINREHIKRMTPERLRTHIESALPGKLRAYPEWSEERFEKIIPILTERIVKFSDITELVESGELDYFFKAPTIDAAKLTWKKDADGVLLKARLPAFLSALDAIPAPFERSSLEAAVLAFIGTDDKGTLLWPLRYALSGKDKSPDPFTIASVIGKEATLERLRQAEKLLHG